MADFVFGGIEADEQRLLNTRRHAFTGIRHYHRITPLDPVPEQPVTIEAEVGPDVHVTRMVAYFTTDECDPCPGGMPAPGVQQIELYQTILRWEPLVWDYVSVWQGELPAQPDGTLVQYRIAGLGAAGEQPHWSREMNLDRTVERPALYGYHVDRFAQPSWAREAVIYQIFVDRFTGVENRWLEPAEMNEFTGGTLRGVIDQMAYFVALGVNALWLTPVFVTPSYHGYDTSDYYRVDPRFGTNEELLELFAVAHAHGLRVILDFVANHTSTDFAPFVAAQADANDEHRRWFSFDPVYKNGYRAFFDVPTMPQLDTDRVEVRDFLAEAAAYWLRAGADGLRLDYAAGPSQVFWSRFRAACRAANPDSWIFGEVTQAGEMLRTYTGRLDGCLDFAFCRAIRMLCAHHPPLLSLTRFANQMERSHSYFGDNFTHPSFIDNHDMNRFLWAAGGDKKRLKMALGLLLGVGGSPILYYGTEVGLGQPRGKGPWREEARHPMLWGDAQDGDLLAYTKALIAARVRSPALTRGDLRTVRLHEEQGVWVVERRSAESQALVILNLGDAPVPVPLEHRRYVGASGATLLPDDGEPHIIIDAHSVEILLPMDDGADS
jgi:glycosidase